MSKVYKIRNKDGLFSPGGQEQYLGLGFRNESIYSSLKFNETGKTWNKIGHVKAHIKNLKVVGSDWEIVEFEIVEKQKFKAADYKNQKAITTDELLIKEIIE